MSPSQHQIRSLNWRLYGYIISLDIYYELLWFQLCHALCGSQTERAKWESINNTLNTAIHRIVTILCSKNKSEVGSRKAKVASRVQGSGKDVGEENRDKEQQDVLNTFASMATS